MSIPPVMNAVTIDGYGDPDRLRPAEVKTPSVGDGEVLIKVAYAGVGIWDVKERDGTFASALPAESKRFPRVIGGDGSGTIVALGNNVTGFEVGDDVYGYAFGSPKGAFYAEYVAVHTSQVAHLPDGMDLLHGAALAIPSTTALRGLVDAIGLTAGKLVAIFGASGSVGLPAVQLAKRMGVKVLAVASGPDGVAAAHEAGADVAIDSKSDDVAAAVKAFAPEGLDGVLATASGDGLDALTAALRPDGTLAFPHGVQPEPTRADGGTVNGYDGNIDRSLLDQLNSLVAKSSYSILLSETLPLAKAADAHRLIEGHHPGRPVLLVGV